MILYFGNMLSKHGFTPGFMDSFVPLLKVKYTVIASSSQKIQIFRLLEMIWIFFRNLKSSKLIIIDTFSTKAFYFAVILGGLSKIFCIPYCPILRGGDLPTRLKKSPKLSQFVFSNSFQNISPSLYLKHEFKKMGFETKYIPNFIEIKKYPFIKRTNIAPKILWVRSFHKIYNPQLAVEILKELLIKYPNTELCMVGPDKDGSMRNVKKTAKKLGVENNLKIAGKLEKSDWIKLSENYDIFLNTTNFDNHPVSVIEAMALGLPIVSTKVGGITFLLKDKIDAFLIAKNDKIEAVEAIEKIIENKPQIHTMIANARKKAEGFSWKNAQRLWSEVIDEFV